MNYLEKLSSSIRKSESVLCVGLDPNIDLIPEALKQKYANQNVLVEQFCSDIIAVTSEHCSAYKPNLAFFEALGPAGLTVFDRVVKMIPDDKIVIADAKRGDIGTTAEQYKNAYFDRFDVDAITLNPMMGLDTFDPFIRNASKAIYSLVLTSNKGANDLLLRRFEGRLTLAEYIADQLRKKMEKSRTRIGMVVGATHPSDLKQILSAYPHSPLLIPGIGSQGGKIDDLISLLNEHQGIPLISSSRSIIYAGNNHKQWKIDVSESAKRMKQNLKEISKRYVQT